MVCMFAGCETPPVVDPVFVGYDPKETEWALTGGDNSVHGRATAQTAEGEEKTCAGLSVGAIPYSPYHEERFNRIYGDAKQNGVQSEAQSDWVLSQIGPPDSAVNDVYRSALCDASGRFHIEGLADGSWYIITTVRWKLVKSRFSSTNEGIVFFELVELSNGIDQELEFTVELSE